MTNGLKALGARLKGFRSSSYSQPRASSLEPRASRGFSLIEVIISMAILSVGIVGAIRVFPVGLRASQRAEFVSLATLAAERTIESLKLKSWDALIAGESSSHDAPFHITLSVDQPEVEGVVDPSRLKRVVVTVDWTQQGRVRSLTVVTYVRRPSP